MRTSCTRQAYDSLASTRAVAASTPSASTIISIIINSLHSHPSLYNRFWGDALC
jgi:hypothetical protein